MKTNNRIKLIALVVALQLSFFQSFSHGWIKDLNYLGLSGFPYVIPTHDGGYLLTGYIQATGAVLIKTDANGDVLWTRDLSFLCGGYGGLIQETADFGFISAMKCSTVVKFNSTGDTVWTRDLGAIFRIEEVRQTADGGYIAIGGDFYNVGTLVKLFKLDQSGALTWSKQIPMESSSPDWVKSWGYSVDQTNDGGYVIGEQMNFQVEPYVRVKVVKTDPAGDTLWTRDLSNDGVLGYVRQSKTGDGYLAGGQLQYVPGSPVPTYSYGIVRLDTVGHFRWGIACLVATGFLFDEDVNGQVFSVGNASNSSLRKMAPDGTVLWQRYFDGLIARSLQQTADKGFIITAEKFDNSAGRYYYLIKADSNGIAPAPIPTGISVDNISTAISISPNPSNQGIQIAFNQEEAGNLKLELFNTSGQSVSVLMDEPLSPGKHHFNYALNVVPGMYFLKISSARMQEVVKVILE